MATKRNGKKKKNPCGDGFTVDPKYVQKDPSKPKFKCIKIKKRPPSGIREKEDDRPKPPKPPKKDAMNVPTRPEK